jgi:hypothetical protein
MMPTGTPGRVRLCKRFLDLFFALKEHLHRLYIQWRVVPDLVREEGALRRALFLIGVTMSLTGVTTRRPG